MTFDKENRAAEIIQRFWRRYLNIQVFKYYLDLLNFFDKGNPMEMLRSINPNEAKLLDVAAGGYVRFRLDGQHFPPTICYKIYTYRPIQDMCSNSPKDYTHPSSKQLHSKFVNNKIQMKQYDKEEGWYKRYENNGWRMVSSRFFASYKQNTTLEKYCQPQKFHHVRLTRINDMNKRRKDRKIKWMQKMYREGRLITKTRDEKANMLVKKATEGIIRTYNKQGCDCIEDWEVDELLKWTNCLNFDEYQKNWLHSGTTKILLNNYSESKEDIIKT